MQDPGAARLSTPLGHTVTHLQGCRVRRLEQCQDSAPSSNPLSRSWNQTSWLQKAAAAMVSPRCQEKEHQSYGLPLASVSPNHLSDLAGQAKLWVAAIKVGTEDLQESPAFLVHKQLRCTPCSWAKASPQTLCLAQPPGAGPQLPLQAVLGFGKLEFGREAECVCVGLCQMLLLFGCPS